MSKHSTSPIDQAGGKVTMQRAADTRERQIKGSRGGNLGPATVADDPGRRRGEGGFFVAGDFWCVDSVLTACGKEMLRLPAGQIETRHFTTRGNNGSIIDVWRAPAWRNAPARIRIELGSIVVDLKAAEVEIDGQVLARAPEAPPKRIGLAGNGRSVD